jgi:hypothetical protein
MMLALRGALAFALLFAWAAARPDAALLVPLSVAWALLGAIHLAWHGAHLDGLGTADAIVRLAGLAVVLAPPLLAVAALRRRRPERRRPAARPARPPGSSGSPRG